MKFNYYQKFSLFFLLLAFLIGILVISINITREIKEIRNKTIEEKTVLAEFLAQTIEVAQAKTAIAFHQQLIKELAEVKDVDYIRIVKPDGEISLTNEREELGKYINDPAHYAKETLIKDDIFKNKKIKVVIVPFLSGQTLWLGFSVKSALEIFKEALLVNSMILFPVLAITMIVALFFSKSLIDPIKKLIKGVELIRKGDLEHRIIINRKDEIGELADSFNRMTSDLKSSQGELKKYGDKLQELVKERTEQLDKKIIELEKFQKLTVGRELKMIELKKKIAELENKQQKHGKRQKKQQ